MIDIYVATGGNDSNSGRASGSAVATISRACRIIERLLLATRPNEDIALHIANGAYAEDVVLTLPVELLKRLLLTADRATMTVVASGTITGVPSTTTIEDTGAALGTNTSAGYYCRIKNAGVEQETVQVRNHTGTVITFVRHLPVVPSVGWTWEIVRPAVTIRSLNIMQPQPGVGVDGSYYDTATKGPTVILMALAIGDGTATEPFVAHGGDVYSTLTTYTGHATSNSRGIRLKGRAHMTSTFVVSGTSNDPFLGIGSRYQIAYCGPRVSVPVGDGIRVDDGYFNGTPVVIGPPTISGIVAYDFRGGYFLWGGACHGCEVKATGGAVWVQALGTQAFLSQGVTGPNACFHFDRATRAEVSGVQIRGCTVAGFDVHQEAICEIGTVDAAAGDILGYGVRTSRGGRVGFATGSAFDSTLGLIADTSQAAHADIQTGTPLRGVNGASIYRHAGDVPLEDVNGIIHYYVDPTGSDVNSGATGSPVATLGRACRLVEDLIAASRPDNDIVVHIANGTYLGLPDFKLPVPPKRRLVFMGDRATMTVNESGTVTSGDARSLTDIGQAWAANEWAGQWCKIRTAGGTDLGLTQIRSNTANQLKFTSSVAFSVAATMLYEIVVPAVMIEGFCATLPWSQEIGITAPEREPSQLEFAYITFGPWTYSYPDPRFLRYALQLNGGATVLSACRLRGTSFSRCVLENGNVSLGQYLPYADDPVYGNDAVDWSWLYTAGVWLDNLTIETTNGRISGSFVAHNGGLYATPGSIALFNGGALYGESSILVQQGGEAFLSSDIVSGWPFLASGITENYAFRSKANSEMSVEGIELEGPFTLYAFLADQRAHLRLKGVTASGNIPYGVVCARGSLVAVAPGASFACGSGVELLADAEVGTFAGIDVEPLIGSTTAAIVRDTQ